MYTSHINVMKVISTASLLCCVLLFMAVPVRAETAPAKWSGVDEVVIEHAAKKAGRPAREPFINTDQGDLLLFLFLVAGAVGGFVAGYAYRSLAKSPSDGEKR
jgi:ABC-type cobalt transport system substrate-binding protein